MDNDTRTDVVTFGESMMALFSPLDGPLQVGGTASCSFAGAESNVSLGLARLGHRVLWLSSLGDDLFGREIVKRLRGEGIDVSQVQHSTAAPTGVLFQSRRAWAEPEVLYYRSQSAFANLTADSFDLSVLQGARVLLLGGIAPALGDGPLELTRRLMRAAREAGLLICFDVNYRSKLWSRDRAREVLRPLVADADIVLAGVDEARLLNDDHKNDNDGDDHHQQAVKLCELGPRVAILKRGTEGSVWLDETGHYRGEAVRLPRIASPIGAGDAFAAGLISAHLEGLEPAESLQRAHAVAAMVCLSSGDWEGLPRRDELESFLHGRLESR